MLSNPFSTKSSFSRCLFPLLLLLLQLICSIGSAPSELSSSTPAVEEEDEEEEGGGDQQQSNSGMLDKMRSFGSGIVQRVWGRLTGSVSIAISGRANRSSTATTPSANGNSANGNWNEARVDLLNQKRHTGDIVELWEDDELTGEMRNALKSSANNRWTNQRDSDNKYIIPYVISGTFSSEQRAVIQKAMDTIDQNTCIRYRQRRSEADYVDIQNRKDEGCYTTIGRLRGRQVLMLETGSQQSCGRGCQRIYPGCVDHATVIHELMHKIGLWHEQMRYDRDDFIKIHWENIPNQLHPQFRKVGRAESTTYGVPYDYRSVMHYGKSSGARQRGQVTMETVNKRFQDVIGNAKDASSDDYRKICLIYQCTRCMRRAFTPLRVT